VQLKKLKLCVSFKHEINKINMSKLKLFIGIFFLNLDMHCFLLLFSVLLLLMCVNNLVGAISLQHI